MEQRLSVVCQDFVFHSFVGLGSTHHRDWIAGKLSEQKGQPMITKSTNSSCRFWTLTPNPLSLITDSGPEATSNSPEIPSLSPASAEVLRICTVATAILWTTCGSPIVVRDV